jgi:hypothetical protein
MVAAWLLANAKGPRPWADPRFLWTSIALAGLILLGVLLIAWLDRWRRQSEPQPLTANDQLAHFRELHEKGELSQAEFDRIRAKLGGELQQELDLSGRDAAGQPVEPRQKGDTD